MGDFPVASYQVVLGAYTSEQHSNKSKVRRAVTSSEIIFEWFFLKSHTLK